MQLVFLSSTQYGSVAVLLVSPSVSFSLQLSPHCRAGRQHDPGKPPHRQRSAQQQPHGRLLPYDPQCAGCVGGETTGGQATNNLSISCGETRSSASTHCTTIYYTHTTTNINIKKGDIYVSREYNPYNKIPNPGRS